MRVSTNQSWSNALSNLMAAQDRQNTANNQYSTQKVATDLMGYGRSSEIIAAYQSSLARTDSYISVSDTVADRLSSQDLALNTTADSTTAAKDAIMNSLASANGSTLMLDLQGTFSSAVTGLNFQHNGQYLFAGGSNQGAPVAVNSLSQLGSLTAVSDAFTNGTVRKSSQIDASTTIQTGMLASDLGTQLMGLYKDIQNYNDNPATGPFGASLTDTQKTYLTTKGQEFSTIYNKMLEQVSINGTMQKHVENTQTSLKSQSDSLSQMVSSRTDVDLAKAYSDMQQAQVAVQASAQVVAGLKSTSLLDILR